MWLWEGPQQIWNSGMFFFSKIDITSSQNIQSKEEAAFSLNRWTLLLVHGEISWLQGTRVCPALGGGNWAQGWGQCGAGMESVAAGLTRGKDKGGWCLHCCPALTASLLIDHNSKCRGISNCATFLPCSGVERRAVGWLGLATGLALQTVREK